MATDNRKLLEKAIASLGIDFELPAPPPPTPPEAQREAEAVLAYLGNQALFNHRTCKRCGELFLATYGAVGYCSDDCRQKTLQDMGISWDATRAPEERWSIHTDSIRQLNSVPLMIGPAATHVLQNYHLEETQTVSNGEYSEPQQSQDQSLVQNQEQEEPIQPLDEVSLLIQGILDGPQSADVE